MVRINPNNNSVLNLRKTTEMKNAEETKKITKTYEPTAPQQGRPQDVIDIDNHDTPT